MIDRNIESTIKFYTPTYQQYLKEFLNLMKQVKQNE